MLFKKAAIFTDIHHGKKNNSEIHNKDCSDYIDWMLDNAANNSCDAIIMMGDFYEKGKSVDSLTQSYAYKNAKKLSEYGSPVYFLVGNHDIYYREHRTIHNMPWIGNLPNILEINEVTLLGDCLFCPWLVGEEYSIVINTPSKYVFGHFELPLFLQNQMHEAEDKGGLHGDHFSLCEEVYSGHFHLRQQKINTNNILISYIGNTFPMNFSDVHDIDRGMAILEWGKPAEYLNWTDCPRYERIKLSQLLNQLEHPTFHPKTTLECSDDVGINMDDILSIKEIMAGYVRKFTLEPMAEKIESEVAMVIGDKESVDDVVIDSLKKLDTDDRYDRELLIEMYKNA